MDPQRVGATRHGDVPGVRRHRPPLEVSMGRSWPLAGGFSGALLTPPLVALLYLMWRIAGLPFPPFDLFDATARVLPGALITAVIDAMVAVIRALSLGPTSAAAKTAEQGMAIATFFFAGTVVGAALFAVRRGRTDPSRVPGLLAGALFGAPAAWAGVSAGSTRAVGPVAGALWVLAAFLTWGMVLDRVRLRWARAAPAG
ncbi:MAG: hypothetical protein HY321_08255, partial [Armatimonadetes bacterium]|nr:hypothetical protein [Armatimonadota bacterium]